MDCLNITFEDSLDLEEIFENNIYLVGRLIADNEPSMSVVKKVLRSAWNKMRVVGVQLAKANVYAITVGEEAVAMRILEGNPWFISDYTFPIKLWSSFHSLDDIEADRAVFWIHAHGIPQNFCTMKNARCLGSKIGAMLEVEDPKEVGFRGFLKLRVDFDASRPLLTCFSVPCPRMGSYMIRLKYKGLKIFCYQCDRLGHSRGCLRPALLLASDEGRYTPSLQAETLSRANSLLFPIKRVATAVEAQVDHWRSKWEESSGVFHGGPETELDIPTNRLKTNWRDKELTSSPAIPPATRQVSSEVIGSFAELVSHGNQARTSNLAESNRRAKHHPTTRLDVRPDYAHMWHLDSYGTQFTNGTLTIAVNGLSLDKDWCDPRRSHHGPYKM